VIGILENEALAESVVASLQSAGFSGNETRP
jgi:hypothetical protein